MQQGKTFNIKEVRQIISQKDRDGDYEIFSVRAYTCDLKRGKTSEPIEIEFAKLHKQNYEIINVMIMARNEVTRNIVPTGNIISLHLSLIDRINNVEVLWT